MRRSRFVARCGVLWFAGVVATSQAATLTVNSLSDAAANDGVCTLREAITAANTDSASGAAAGECPAGSGSDVIEFSVAGTIQPASQLPTITTVIHIDGYTAPGSSTNTLALTQGTNAVLVIEIDGVNAGNVPGLSLQGAGAAGSIIEGLVINRSAPPAFCCNTSPILVIDVGGASSTIIRGNFIGTNTTGTASRSTGSRAIYLGNASNFVVGSDTGGAIDPAAVNLISGNEGDALTITNVSGLRFRGNLAGTNAAGTAALVNSGRAVFADGLTNSTISDNVLSGGTAGGMWVRQGSSGVDIERNFIGTNAAGTAGIPNLLGGIHISENPNVVQATSISDIDIVENLIAYNNCSSCSGGIVIGLSKAGNTVEGIRLSGNRVFSNEGLEIDLTPANGSNTGPEFGVTENDPNDADTAGGNRLQNFPVITTVEVTGLTADIDWTFNGEANTEFTFEFFHTSACDPSGHGGGSTALGTDVQTTNGSGDAGGQVSLTLPTEYGYITATATNVDNGTSEFSACFRIDDDVFKDGFET